MRPMLFSPGLSKLARALAICGESWRFGDATFVTIQTLDIGNNHVNIDR